MQDVTRWVCVHERLPDGSGTIGWDRDLAESNAYRCRVSIDYESNADLPARVRAALAARRAFEATHQDHLQVGEQA